MKRKPDSSPIDVAAPRRVHPLLGLHIEETNHVISKSGRAACENDPDLEPGLNCCAVCASKPKELLECPNCHRVKYCNATHQAADAKHHDKVCKLLAVVAAAEDIKVEEEQEQQLLSDFTSTSKALGKASAWLDVVPDKYKAVLGGDGGDGRKKARAGRRSAEVAREGAGAGGSPSPAPTPTQHTNGGAAAGAGGAGAMPMETTATPGVLPHLSPTEDSPSQHRPSPQQQQQPTSASKRSPAHASTPGSARAAAAAAASEIMPADEAGPSAVVTPVTAGGHSQGGDLVTAVHMAVSSSYLSYPFTLAHAMGTNASMAAVVSKAEAGRRPVVVTVLGASAMAELKHMGTWKALGGVCAGGVVLQCVGPEVPSHLHLSHQSLGEGIKAVFFQGEYHELVVQVLPAYGEPGTSSSANGVPGASGEASKLLCMLPDVLAGYNTGLTCPDYDWTPTLAALLTVFRLKCSPAAASAGAASSSAGTAAAEAARGFVRLPWLLTTNTHVEAMMEEEVVREAGWGVSAGVDRNAFSSLEPLQSGTLGNDLYRKNAWFAVYELVRAPLGPAGSGGRKRGRSLKQRLGGLVSKVVGALPRLPWRRR